jgi:hypothetical protein
MLIVPLESTLVGGNDRNLTYLTPAPFVPIVVEELGKNHCDPTPPLPS